MQSKSDINGADSAAQLLFTSRIGVSNGMRDDASYVIRIESLDTGESKDYRLNLKYSNIDQKSSILESGVYAPSNIIK